MQRHIGRIVKFVWLPGIFMVGVLSSDMPSAVSRADRNIHFILSNAGWASAPNGLATYAWSHPWAATAFVIALFVLGSFLSYIVEKTLKLYTEFSIKRRFNSDEKHNEQREKDMAIPLQPTLQVAPPAIETNDHPVSKSIGISMKESHGNIFRGKMKGFENSIILNSSDNNSFDLDIEK